mmetsp:Transcript_13894/g.21330  ORF Transcript_13894/g.21330 Transcript_13894/m.21330 type:complete len:363 (-) Transcript_13894:105-1193(-)
MRSSIFFYGRKRRRQILRDDPPYSNSNSSSHAYSMPSSHIMSSTKTTTRSASLLILALIYILSSSSDCSNTVSAFSNLPRRAAAVHVYRISNKCGGDVDSSSSGALHYQHCRSLRSRPLFSVSSDSQQQQKQREKAKDVNFEVNEDDDILHSVAVAIDKTNSSREQQAAETVTENNNVVAKPALENDIKIDDNNDDEGTNAVAGSFNLPYSQPLREFLAQPVVEIIFSLLVALSTFLVALETPNFESYGSIPRFMVESLPNVENVIAGIFTVEFFARWYGFGQLTGRYLRKFLVIIDLLVVVLPFRLSMAPALNMMLPPVLSATIGLATLGLLRIVRLQRVLLTFWRLMVKLKSLWDARNPK